MHRACIPIYLLISREKVFERWHFCGCTPFKIAVRVLVISTWKVFLRDISPSQVTFLFKADLVSVCVIHLLYMILACSLYHLTEIVICWGILWFFLLGTFWWFPSLIRSSVLGSLNSIHTWHFTSADNVSPGLLSTSHSKSWHIFLDNLIHSVPRLWHGGSCQFSACQLRTETPVHHLLELLVQHFLCLFQSNTALILCQHDLLVVPRFGLGGIKIGHLFCRSLLSGVSCSEQPSKTINLGRLSWLLMRG